MFILGSLESALQLPISVNWTFSPSRYERKEIENRRFRSNAVSLIQNFRYKGLPPTNHFCTYGWANEWFTTLPLTVFKQRNFVADFLQAKCDFRRKSAVLRFSAPLWGLRGNVRCISSPIRLSVCLSVCLSSVTLVRPTQTIEIFGNVSMPFGTFAIWLFYENFSEIVPVEPLRRVT